MAKRFPTKPHQPQESDLIQNSRVFRWNLFSSHSKNSTVALPFKTSFLMEMYLKLRLSVPKNQRNIVAGVLNDNEERKTGHDQGVESVPPPMAFQ